MDVDGDGKSEYFGLWALDAFLHRQQNGALELVQSFPQLIPCDFIETMRTTDLNADGFGDVVLTLGCDGQADGVPVLVLLGAADNTLTVAGQYPTGAGPSGLEIGDVNGDGRQDVVTVNLGTKEVNVLLGLGDGSLAEQLRFAVEPRIDSFVIGAFDGAAGDELLLVRGDATWVFAPLGTWDEPRAVMGTSQAGPAGPGRSVARRLDRDNGELRGARRARGLR